MQKLTNIPVSLVIPYYKKIIYICEYKHQFCSQNFVILKATYVAAKRGIEFLEEVANKCINLFSAMQ